MYAGHHSDAMIMVEGGDQNSVRSIRMLYSFVLTDALDTKTRSQPIPGLLAGMALPVTPRIQGDVSSRERFEYECCESPVRPHSHDVCRVKLPERDTHRNGVLGQPPAIHLLD